MRAIASLGQQSLHSTLWTPYRLQPSLWLDAQDSSTITLNGSTVSQWRDKSPNGQTVIQPTATNQPGYVSTSTISGLPAVTFDGTNKELYRDNATMPAGQSALSWFYVINNNGTTSGREVFGWGNNTAGGRFGAWIESTLRFGIEIVNRGVVTQLDQGNATMMQGMVFSGFATVTTTNVAVLKNGSSQSTGVIGTSVTLAVPTPQPQLKIGGIPTLAPGSGYNLNASLGEILVLGSAVSTAQRQAIEGYLAWKWGLQLNLPSTHPFRIGPPRV